MSEETERWECRVLEGKFVEPCIALSGFVEGQAAFSRSKGIHVWSCYKFGGSGRGERTRTFYGFLNMGPKDRRKEGALISFCPFCGTDISAPFTPAEDAAATTQPT